MGVIRRACFGTEEILPRTAVFMSIKTKCIRCSQFFGAPDQTLGKVAKCPYCGAPNDIVDLSNDDDELAALIEEERKKAGGGKAASAFSDPLAPARASRCQEGSAAKRLRKLASSAFSKPAGYGNAAGRHGHRAGTGNFGDCAWNRRTDCSDRWGPEFQQLSFRNFWLGVGSGRLARAPDSQAEPGRRCKPGKPRNFGLALPQRSAWPLWGTFSFAMPAFPVLTSGKGFESHSLGYLAKMFLLWFAILAFGAGLFVMGGRQKLFSLASWTYILACGVLLLLFTPFSEGVGHVRGLCRKRTANAACGNIPPGQPRGNVANQPPAGEPNGDKSAGAGSAIEPSSTNRTTASRSAATAAGIAACAGAEQQPTEKPLPQIAWQVAPDPDPNPDKRPYVRQPAIPVPSSTDLAWPKAISPLMAVLNRNQSEPSAQLWDLSIACGKGSIHGSFDFKDSILLSRDGKYLGGNGEFGTEIWSFETGKLLARLPL